MPEPNKRFCPQADENGFSKFSFSRFRPSRLTVLHPLAVLQKFALKRNHIFKKQNRQQYTLIINIENGKRNNNKY